MPFGSHDILIGVIAESVVRDGQPLVYSNRSYGKVTSFSTGVAALGRVIELSRRNTTPTPTNPTRMAR